MIPILILEVSSQEHIKLDVVALTEIGLLKSSIRTGLVTTNHFTLKSWCVSRKVRTAAKLVR